MPNLDSFLPVEMYRWVLGSTSGLTRSAMGATLPMSAGDAVDRVQFGLAFDIEHEDAGVEGLGDLLVGLAHAREDGFARVSAGGLDAEQFSARDDVEAAAVLGEELQDAQVRVRLHGVADQRVDLGEGFLKGLELARESGGAVDVKGGAVLPGEVGDGDLFAVELVVSVFEGVHGRLGFGSGSEVGHKASVPCGSENG